MNTLQPQHPRRALWSGLLTVLLAAAVTVAVLIPALLRSPGPAPMVPAGPGSPVMEKEETLIDRSAPEGCTAAQMIEPGEYESVQRTRRGLATWVIIPDFYGEMAPAPLYVLTVTDFTGAPDDLELLRPVFTTLDGVVLVTVIEGADDEFVSLMDEVMQDFCIDAQQVITSMVQLPSVPLLPAPEVPDSEKPMTTA